MLNPDPKLDFLEILLVGGDKAIPAQEKRGQTDLVESTSLPIKGSSDPEFLKSPIKIAPFDQENPEKPGDLFRKATLPPGWTKRASDHSMWSYVCDENGCRRAAVFYKAAFYDREAFIRLEQRFYMKQDYSDASYAKADTEATFQVTDMGQGYESKVIYSKTYPLPDRETDRDAHYAASNAAKAEMEAAFKKRYPNFKDPNAYWGDPLVPW